MQNQRRPFLCKRCGAYIDTRKKRPDGSLQCPECKMIYRPRPTQSQELQPQTQITKRQPQTIKKRWSKKKILGLAVVIMLLIILVGSCGNNNQDDIENGVSDELIDRTQQGTEQPIQESTQAPTNVPTNTSTVTMGERNALSSAKSYLEVLAFSHNGLYKQLLFDGYKEEEAKYAVDNCGADWNEQAAKQAASYLEFMAFSREGLIEQLEYDGFTHEQAVYGVTQVGY